MAWQRGYNREIPGEQWFAAYAVFIVACTACMPTDTPDSPSGQGAALPSLWLAIRIIALVNSQINIHKG